MDAPIHRSPEVSLSPHGAARISGGPSLVHSPEKNFLSPGQLSGGFPVLSGAPGCLGTSEMDSGQEMNQPWHLKTFFEVDFYFAISDALPNSTDFLL